MIARIAARLAARRPLALAAAFAVLACGAGLFLAQKDSFDPDILGLLPQSEPAVAALRTYSEKFAQSRELAFVIETAGPGATMAAEEFAGLLAGEPWVERVLPPGLPEAGPEVVLPLLFNLPADQFARALSGLSPEHLRSRITRLAGAADAGSPAASLELTSDPLGIARAAFTPVLTSQGPSASLVSPDDSLAVVLCMPAEPGLPAARIDALAENFLQRARPHFSDARLGVTGHAPFAAGIEREMRGDIALTSSVSLACVIGLFWMGYRRLLPLAGIGLMLAFSALLSTALGVGLFGGLNAVAVGFCSILFGLGDDFSLLVCQRYDRARADGLAREPAIASAISSAAPGILWVALTTATGFLALCFAGSAGFRQLGVLVAVGIILAAFSMLSGFPIFLSDPRCGPAKGKCSGNLWKTLASPARARTSTAPAIFAMAVVVAFIPWRVPSLDLSPSSLEPAGIPAARALRLMREKIPSCSEPTLVVLGNPDSSQLAALEATLSEMKSAGLVETASPPTAFVLDPARFAQNAAHLAKLDLHASLPALQAALHDNGLLPEAFSNAENLLTALAKSLPPQSGICPPSPPGTSSSPGP